MLAGLEPPLPCAYSDLTLATTVFLPDVDCGAARGRGLCGDNCLCRDGRHCYALSEEHPLGACVHSPTEGDGVCGEDRDPCAPTESCLRPLARPEWLDRPNLRIVYPVNRGRCVETETCAELRSEYPGVWECARS